MSPSWENVGRAVAGTLPFNSGIEPRVVNIELYETSPPPGKSGGAVSGAGPCALTVETLHKRTRNSHARKGRNMRMGFPDSTDFPPGMKEITGTEMPAAAMRLEERSDTEL